METVYDQSLILSFICSQDEAEYNRFYKIKIPSFWDNHQ